MRKFILEIDKDIDQEQLATIMEQLAKQLREDDLETKELMDGSYQFKLKTSVVWLTGEEE